MTTHTITVASPGLNEERTRLVAPPYRVSFLSAAVVGGMASCLAETVTFPLDWAKTRLQIHGQSAARLSLATSSTFSLLSTSNTSMLRVMSDSIRNEGFFSIFSGLKAALLRQASYGTLKIVIYEQLKTLLEFGQHSPRSNTLGLAFAGALAGGLSAAIANPTDLIKVRLQEGLERSTFSQEARLIYRQEGWRGLYRGVLPTMQRATMIGLLTLTPYDLLKQFLLEKPRKMFCFWGKKIQFTDAVGTHIVCSIFSALVSVVGTQPWDVVKSRLMSHEGRKLYGNSMIRCAVATAKGEGLLALWKGTIPSFARSGPWVITFWLCYEKMKRLL